MALLLAMLPLLVAILMLAVLQRSGLQAGLATVLTALLLVLFVPVFHLSFVLAAQALGQGIAASLTVLYVLLPALWLYQVQRVTGSIETLARGISQLCPERDLQLLLLVIGVAPFVESVSGFGVGSVVIIPMLMALELETMQAAVLGLFGQIAVPWGALAVGTVLGAQITELNANSLSAHTALLSLPVPCLFALLTLLLGGTRGALRRLWPIALAAGLLLALGEWCFSLWVGVELAGVFASIPVMLLLIVVGRIGSGSKKAPVGQVHEQALTTPRFFLAVAPYLILTLLLLLSRFVMPLQHWLQTTGVLSVDAIALHFQLLYNPGFFIFVTVLATLLLTKASVAQAREAGVRTLRQFTPGAIAIASFLAASQVMSNSGMIAVLGGAAATLGIGYGWVAPWLGALGGWITGSNAGGMALFAQLQRATSLKAHLPVYWIVASQNGADSIATMAAPARVVLATTTAGLVGKEGHILRKVALPVLCAIALIMFMLIVIIR
jgi:lactate permease